jgi:hypothetical protein
MCHAVGDIPRGGRLAFNDDGREEAILYAGDARVQIGLRQRFLFGCGRWANRTERRRGVSRGIVHSRGEESASCDYNEKVVFLRHWFASLSQMSIGDV